MKNPNKELEGKIWCFILRYYENWGVSPLRSEIAKEVEVSEQLVQHHLKNLETKGKIHFDPLKKRNILIGGYPQKNA